MKAEQLPLRPARKPRYPDLKECLRKNVWGSGRDSASIAVDARIDPSVLSRWMSDGDNDNAAKWVNKFIPLLVALGESGLDVYAYIGEEIRAAQDAAREDDEAAANRIIREMGPAVFEALKIKMGAKK